MEKSSKKLWISLGVAAIVVIAIVVVAMQSQNSSNPAGQVGGEKPADEGQLTEASNDASVVPNNEELESAPLEGLSPEAVEVLKDAVVIAPGANPITKDNKVVTPEGVQTDNAARPMSEEAPHQTGFLDKETLPDALVKINVGNGAFTPNTFKAKAGAPTSFALTGVDSFSHVLAFNDPVLSAVAILVGPGQTKAITFNAPTEPGSYTFRNDSPGHTETGVMIVE